MVNKVQICLLDKRNPIRFVLSCHTSMFELPQWVIDDKLIILGKLFFFNLGTSCSYFHRTSFYWTLNILCNILFFPHYLQHYFKSSNEGVAKCVKGNGNHTAVCVETQYPHTHTHTVPHYVMTFNVFSDAAGPCCGAPGPYGILPCWLAGYQATWSHTHGGLHEACVCVRSWSICVTRVRTHDLCENLFAGTYASV